MGTLTRTNTVSVETDATPEQVWNLLTDIARAGEWSHENQGGEWVGDASHPAPGAFFRGRNENGRYRWSRQCEVLEVEAPRRISWRTVPTTFYRDSTIWTYEIDPTERGSRITQRYQVTQLGPIMDRVLYAIVPAHRDRSAALQADLERLGERASELAVA